MLDKHFTYLIINFLSILYPLAQSFEHPLNYYKKWKFLFPSILLTGVFFIVWDIFKTGLGIWSFNPDFIVGIYFFNLPVEECLFFLTIPYALVFIYEVLNYYIKKDVLGNYGIRIAQYLGILNIIISLIFYDKSYTFVALLLNGIFLLLHSYLFRFKWLGRFFLAYLISLLPFFIVNGLLTSMPVVIYNDAENTGLRLFTIPIEDTMYSMLLFLVNITIYENLKMRWKKKNL